MVSTYLRTKNSTYFVQQFAAKSELRLRLAIGHFIVADELEDLLCLARKDLVDVRGIYIHSIAVNIHSQDPKKKKKKIFGADGNIRYARAYRATYRRARR